MVSKNITHSVSHNLKCNKGIFEWDYETGKEIGADINVEYVPTVPYSSEGVEMKNLVCIEDGKLKNMHANCRYA